MKPTYILAMLVLVILAAVLAAELSEAERPDESVARRRVVLASRLWQQPNEQAFVREEILRDFEAEHACLVDLQILADGKLFDRVRVQQETGNVSTDAALVYVSRLPQWVEAGLIQPLAPHAAAWQGHDFVAAFTGMTVFDGEQYFLPIGADDYLLCANRAALDHLPTGVDVQAITWEELVAWALAVAEAEGGGRYAVAAKAGAMLTYQVAAAILSYGGGFPDVASPEAREAWAVLARLRPALSPTVQTYESVVPPMKRGETWLTVTHNARVGEIYASNPDQFLIAPAPRGPAGRGSVAGVSALGIVRGAPQPELAAKLLAYLTSPEVQVRLSRGTGGFIPTVGAATELLGEATEDEVIQTSMQVLREGRLAYIPPIPAWGDEVKPAYEAAFRAVVLEPGAPDPALLASLQARIDRAAAAAAE
jgi:multiple sugar transport system substrate-binding protein